MVSAGFGDRVEGLNAVAAAAAGGRVVDLWIERPRLARAGALIESVGRSGGRVHEIDSVRDVASTENPQGVVARCRPLPVATLEQLAQTERPALIVLDHIVDPQNLGAIARSALGAGMSGMVTSTRRAAPLSATAFKAAAGALELLPVALVNSIADALTRLGRLGIWTLGLDPKAKDSLFGLPLLTEPVAIVIGGEGSGLSLLVRQKLEATARIPHREMVESLNASIAAALAAFEVMRVRGEAGAGPEAT
jgi:23S rRNA (guanosine2251-2'-O)-methyltransferase